MFGQHSRNLDDKNRVVLPSAFKEFLGSTFMVTIGFDGNAEMRSLESFEIYKQKIENNSYFTADVRTITRFIMGNTFEAKLDSVGRFSVPKNIIDKLSIQKEITFVGAGSLIELWSKEKYDEVCDKYSLDDMAEIAEKISGNNGL